MELISSSVGKKGINRYADVSVVQVLLNDCLHLLYGPKSILQEDGKIGPITIARIEDFQKTVMVMSNPDGRVDPGGMAIRNLNVKAKPPEKISNTVYFPKVATVLNKPKPLARYSFPLKSRPVQSYKTGMRRFGSGRSRGRKHAGCDMYAPIGTPVFAMDDGVVQTEKYSFYLGTYAIEIKHTDFLARYGELGTVVSSLRKGTKVRRGQKIGTVGELRGLNMSMLHLELYGGSDKGPLTVRSLKPYQRRGDLIDPTLILDSAK